MNFIIISIPTKILILVIYKLINIEYVLFYIKFINYIKNQSRITIYLNANNIGKF